MSPAGNANANANVNDNDNDNKNRIATVGKPVLYFTRIIEVSIFRILDFSVNPLTH